MLSKTAVTEAIRRHGKAPLIYLGTAVAVAGAGTATAAAATAPPAPAGHAATVPAAFSRAATTPAAIGHALSGPAAFGHAVVGPAVRATGPALTLRHSPAGGPNVRAGTAGTPREAGAQVVSAIPARQSASADRKPTVGEPKPAVAQPKPTAERKPAAERKPVAERKPAAEPKPTVVPMADRLLTGPVSGPQEWMPITPARWENAAAIVRQALDKHLGVRSAVIAVATSMQEANLDNINYGTSDSLGLFQQRPSCGWGSPAQIMDPSYAADAFLNALHAHQEADHSWASQPLWANAQAVQGSAYPTAYAKWEAQAASLVQSITTH